MWKLILYTDAIIAHTNNSQQKPDMMIIIIIPNIRAYRFESSKVKYQHVWSAFFLCKINCSKPWLCKEEYKVHMDKK